MKRKILYLILGLVSSGCKIQLDGDKAPPVPKETRHIYSLNGVKLISPAITNRKDPSTMTQDYYRLTPQERLLLRYESFMDHLKNVVVEGEKKVELQVTVADETSLSQAAQVLRVCPLSKNWSMYATWTEAHPFIDGLWVREGGDYDDQDCAQQVRTEGRSVFFDLQPWFVDYARGRGQNYGVILWSDLTIVIYGDHSGNDSPRMTWVEVTQVESSHFFRLFLSSLSRQEQ